MPTLMSHSHHSTYNDDIITSRGGFICCNRLTGEALWYNVVGKPSPSTIFAAQVSLDKLLAQMREVQSGEAQMGEAQMGEAQIGMSQGCWKGKNQRGANGSGTNQRG